MFIIRILGLYSDDLAQGAAPHLAEILGIDPHQALRAANGDELTGSAEDVAQLVTLLPVHAKHVTITAKHTTNPPAIHLPAAREASTYRRALEDARKCKDSLRMQLSASIIARTRGALVVHGD
jgi:hypothetical protein